VLAILYVVGCIDGVLDAGKLYTRNLLSLEKLKFQPLLVQSDHQYLFTEIRIKNIITGLHDLGVFEEVDIQAFAIKRMCN
jgi:hypothetical protein